MHLRAVGIQGEKLIDQVAVRAVYFDKIKTGLVAAAGKRFRKRQSCPLSLQWLVYGECP